MEEQKQAPEAAAAEETAADQETVAHSRQEDELQEILDEKVAGSLLNSELEVETSGEEEPVETVSPEIVQQTIDAEEMQEFLSRGVIHENLRRIFVGRHSETMAIIVSSLLFGALHIHRGFMYMIAATALLSLFGILYRRQNSIWGLCIPHFVLGEIVWFLGFV